MEFVDEWGIGLKPFTHMDIPVVSPPDTEWREQAACLEYPSILFFGLDDSEGPADRRAREDEAKRICAGCNVRTECLEYALEMREPYGIWGGLTELERKTRLRSRVVS